MKIISKGERAFDIINTIIMCLVGLMCFFPFVYMMALSLSSAEAVINNQVSIWPVGFTFESYAQIFAYPNFFRAYGNTLFYTIVGTMISLFMTIIFAYPLSKNYIKGKNTIMKFVVFSMFFSGGVVRLCLVNSS